MFHTQVILKEMAKNSKRATVKKTQFHSPDDDENLKRKFLLKVILEKGEFSKLATTLSLTKAAAATANYPTTKAC